jgi:hypothetical protein
MQQDQIQALTDAISTALAAAGGGGVFYAISKFFAVRAFEKQDQHNQKLIQMEIRLAVLEAALEDCKSIRRDLEAGLGHLRGEVRASLDRQLEDLDDLKKDVFVAHERVRMIASGDTDISKVSTPQKIRRRI